MSSIIRSNSFFAPLSWGFDHRTRGIRLYSVPLRTGARFIPFGRHNHVDSATFRAALLAELSSSTSVVRGLPSTIAEQISTSSYRLLSFGSEGVLPLPSLCFSRSVESLRRRAHRKGVVSESLSHSDLYERREWACRSDIQLKGLFRRDLGKQLRVFCFHEADHISGYISLSLRSPGHYHLEVMNRDVTAPVGAMEALISYAAEALQAEGALSVSLGEAPCFLLGKRTAPKALIDRYASAFGNAAGQALLKHSYSPQSLLSFKKKFKLEWQPVYWAVPKRRALAHLAAVGSLTGINRLLLAGIKERFQLTHRSAADFVTNRIDDKLNLISERS